MKLIPAFELKKMKNCGIIKSRICREAWRKMPGYSAKVHYKAKNVDRRMDRSTIRSGGLQDSGVDNSRLLDELKTELHRRSNEIRNTQLSPDTKAPMEEPDEGGGAGIPERKDNSGKSIEKHDDYELSEPDRVQAELVRSFSDITRSEPLRTRLVGMTETAESSTRRMEYLERERDAKERAAANMPFTELDGDLFEFLLRKRGEDDSDREESDDRTDKADS